MVCGDVRGQLKARRRRAHWASALRPWRGDGAPRRDAPAAAAASFPGWSVVERRWVAAGDGARLRARCRSGGCCRDLLARVHGVARGGGRIARLRRAFMTRDGGTGALSSAEPGLAGTLDTPRWRCARDAGRRGPLQASWQGRRARRVVARGVDCSRRSSVVSGLGGCTSRSAQRAPCACARRTGTRGPVFGGAGCTGSVLAASWCSRADRAVRGGRSRARSCARRRAARSASVGARGGGAWTLVCLRGRMSAAGRLGPRAGPPGETMRWRWSVGGRRLSASSWRRLTLAALWPTMFGRGERRPALRRVMAGRALLREWWATAVRAWS
jgi:hypothetical protein